MKTTHYILRALLRALRSPQPSPVTTIHPERPSTVLISPSTKVGNKTVPSCDSAIDYFTVDLERKHHSLSYDARSIALVRG